LYSVLTNALLIKAYTFFGGTSSKKEAGLVVRMSTMDKLDRSKALMDRIANSVSPLMAAILNVSHGSKLPVRSIPPGYRFRHERSKCNVLNIGRSKELAEVPYISKTLLAEVDMMGHS
jgi:hypothetical protein